MDIALSLCRLHRSVAIDEPYLTAYKTYISGDNSIRVDKVRGHEGSEERKREKVFDDQVENLSGSAAAAKFPHFYYYARLSLTHSGHLCYKVRPLFSLNGGMGGVGGSISLFHSLSLSFTLRAFFGGPWAPLDGAA